MSTDNSTQPSSSDAENSRPPETQRKRQMGYSPGERVVSRCKRPANAWKSLPTEVLHQILMRLAESKSGISVILLSMVNRHFMNDVLDDVDVWHLLYLDWRGPIGGPKVIRSKNGIVKLRPTYPISLPNFKLKTPPVTLTLVADKKPTASSTTSARREALQVYRKVGVLTNVKCCGLCGTTRYQTKPYWTLGMRLCRRCLQSNTVSSIVLYERHWITLKGPVQSYESFIDAVHLNVFYFKTRATPLQRMEYSCDKVDFPGGVRDVWFFWKPHLENVLNWSKLEQDGRDKHAASAMVRAHVRRACVLRAFGACKDRFVATPSPSQIFSRRRDIRTLEARLRRMVLLDHAAQSCEAWSRSCMSPKLNERFHRGEDRLPPLMFN